MQRAILQGPISVSIAAMNPPFMSYSSGIFTADVGCATVVDHAVNIVGFNTSGEIPYWIVRNSWSEVWGEKGYIRMQITDGEGTCLINTDNSFPNLLLVFSSLETMGIYIVLFISLMIIMGFYYRFT
jgi:hypothetical protein